jgi:hypothetical protein
MATLKEKQALLKQVEDQIKTLQDKYEKGVNEKESLGKRLVSHFGQERPDFQKEEEFSESDHSLLKDFILFLIMSIHEWGNHMSADAPKTE